MVLFFIGMVAGIVCGILGSIGVALWVRDELANLPLRQSGSIPEGSLR